MSVHSTSPRKGVALTLDAVFSLFIVIFVILILVMFARPATTPVEQSYAIVRDTLSIAQTPTLHSLSDSSYPSIVATLACSQQNLPDTCPCPITNFNNTLLEQIGEFWAKNLTSCASLFAQEFFDRSVPSDYGYELILRDTKGNADVIARREVPYQKLVLTDRRIISGIERESPVMGWSARAFINNMRKQTASFVYFGGYEGDGNITKLLFLPSGIQITNATLEVAISKPVTVIVNGRTLGTFENQSPVGVPLRSSRFILDHSAFQEGKNNITFLFSPHGFIGGGYLMVRYNTTYPILETVFTPGENNTLFFFLPGIDGIINYYSSFYVPGRPTALEMYLHYTSEYPINVTLGAQRVFSSSDPSEQFVNLTENFFDSSFVESMENRTIPLRISSDVPPVLQQLEAALADVIFVVDVSGSMRNSMGNESRVGIVRQCNDPLLNESTTEKMSFAKCLAKVFINDILRTPGSYVGLVSFNNNLHRYHPLSRDNYSLISMVDSYTANGGTCLCCGLNEAFNRLGDTINIIRKGDTWKYFTVRNCQRGCDPANETNMTCKLPAGWYLPSFNDASWPTRTTPADNSVSGGRVYLYRKNFTLHELPISGVLRLRHEEGVVCYLNGNLLYRFPLCVASAVEWNRTLTIGAGNFTLGQNVLACAVRSTASGSTNYPARFTAELDITRSYNPERKRFVVVLSDGITRSSCTGGTFCNGIDVTEDWACVPNGLECFNESITGCGCAMWNANFSAQRIASVNTSIISVGFGDIVNCPAGNNSLWSIAHLANGSYYVSDNGSILWDIFKNITNHIRNVSFSYQTIYVTGSANLSNHLYPDSYVKITYVPYESLNYGEITLTREGRPFGVINPSRPVEGYYNLSNATRVLAAYATSYSSQYWTHYVEAGESTLPVFQLSWYGTNYSNLGDPFLVYIPSSFWRRGEENRIYITSSGGYGYPEFGSADNRVIFTYAIEGTVPYGAVFPRADGCTMTIWYDVTGDGIRDGNTTVIFGNGTSCVGDAKADAVKRLLKKLISVDRGGEPGSFQNPIDIQIDDESGIGFSVVESRGIPYMWGPAVAELRMWK